MEIEYAIKQEGQLFYVGYWSHETERVGWFKKKKVVVFRRLDAKGRHMRKPIYCDYAPPCLSPFFTLNAAMQYVKDLQADASVKQQPVYFNEHGTIITRP